MTQTPREYDIVALGAYGYTASINFPPSSLLKNLSTNLNCAVAGRSKTQFETLVDKLNGITEDRLAPGVCKFQVRIRNRLMAFTFQYPRWLNWNKVNLMLCQVRLGLLSTVNGPYHLYFRPVVMYKYGHTLRRIVSIENSTADIVTMSFVISLETSWVEQIIKNFDSLASKTGSIVRRHTSLIFRGQEVETDTTKIAAEVT